MYVIMDDLKLRTLESIDQDNGASMSPLVGRMSDMVASIVPASRRETIQLDEHNPEKTLGIAITRGCKTLSNRFKKIIA